MKKSFTLIELIVVIAIIAILAAIIAPNAFRAIEKAKVAQLKKEIKTMQTVAMAYYADMGFWPPDTYPREDPGFVKPIPYDVVTGDPGRGSVTTHMPVNWQDILNTSWDGPYLEKFPTHTPWGGDYDWDIWLNRGLGVLDNAVYVTVRGFWYGTAQQKAETVVPPKVEQRLVDEGYDSDGAVDGTVYGLITKL